MIVLSSPFADFQLAAVFDFFLRSNLPLPRRLSSGVHLGDRDQWSILSIDGLTSGASTGKLLSNLSFRFTKYRLLVYIDTSSVSLMMTPDLHIPYRVLIERMNTLLREIYQLCEVFASSFEVRCIAYSYETQYSLLIWECVLTMYSNIDSILTSWSQHLESIEKELLQASSILEPPPYSSINLSLIIDVLLFHLDRMDLEAYPMIFILSTSQSFVVTSLDDIQHRLSHLNLKIYVMLSSTSNSSTQDFDTQRLHYNGSCYFYTINDCTLHSDFITVPVALNKSHPPPQLAYHEERLVSHTEVSYSIAMSLLTLCLLQGYNVENILELPVDHDTLDMSMNRRKRISDIYKIILRKKLSRFTSITYSFIFDNRISSTRIHHCNRCMYSVILKAPQSLINKPAYKCYLESTQSRLSQDKCIFYFWKYYDQISIVFTKDPHRLRPIIHHIAYNDSVFDVTKSVSASKSYFHFLKGQSEVEDHIVILHFLSVLEDSSMKCLHFALSAGKFMLVFTNVGTSTCHLIYCEISLLYDCYLKLALVDLGHVYSAFTHVVFEHIYSKLQDTLYHFNIIMIATKSDLSRLCLVDIEFQRLALCLFSSTTTSACINTTYSRLQVILQELIAMKEQQAFHFISYEEDSGIYEQWLFNLMVYCSSKNQYSVLNYFLMRQDLNISITIYYEKEFEGTELQQFAHELKNEDESILKLFASLAPLYSCEYPLIYASESINQMMISGVYDEVSLPLIAEISQDNTNFNSILIQQLISDMVEKMNFIPLETPGSTPSESCHGFILINDYAIVFDIPLTPLTPILTMDDAHIFVFDIKLSILRIPSLKGKHFGMVSNEFFDRLQEMKTFIFKTYISNYSMLIYSSLLRECIFSKVTLEMALLTYRPYSADVDITALCSYAPISSISQAFEDTLGKYLIDSPTRDYFLVRSEAIFRELNENLPLSQAITVNISTAIYVSLEVVSECSYPCNPVIMSSRNQFIQDFFSFLQSFHQHRSERSGAVFLRITCLHNSTIKDFITDHERNLRELQRSQRLKCLETLQRHLHQFVALQTLLLLSSIREELSPNVAAIAHGSFIYFNDLLVETRTLDVISPTLSVKRSDALEEGWAQALVDEACHRIGLTHSSGTHIYFGYIFYCCS